MRILIDIVDLLNGRKRYPASQTNGISYRMRVISD